MLEIVFLRHGQTRNSVEGRPTISAASPGPGLTAHGRSQAARTAAQLRARYDVSAVHASPLLRASQTAEYILDGLDAELVLHQGLAECSVGTLENGSTQREFATLNEQLGSWGQPSGRSVRLGDEGENGFDVQIRLERYLAAQRWDADGTVVAVSHALTLASLQLFYDPDYGRGMRVKPRIPRECGWFRFAMWDGMPRAVEMVW